MGALRLILHLVDRAADPHDVHGGHRYKGHRGNHKHLVQMLFDIDRQQIQHRPRRQQHRKVDEDLLRREVQSVFIAQSRRQNPQILPEEHIVDDCGAAEHPDGAVKDAARSGACEPVENAHPDHERAEGEAEGAHDKPQRVVEIVDVHELLRRGLDDRRRDQQTRQHREKHRPGEEELLVKERLRLLFNPALHRAAGTHEHHQNRHLQPKTRDDEEHLAQHRGMVVEEQPEHQQARARDGREHSQHLSGVLELVENRLDEGEQVVERPVKHQAGGRGIEEHEEEQRHGIELNLRLEEAPLREDHAGDEVHGRHNDRQNVHRKARDGEQSVGLAQIGDRPEGDAV